MGDALWGYEENHDMEQLGQKLLLTTLELEKLKSEATEEMKKNKEYITHLLHLLKYALQERDEAKNHLHNLLNKNNISFSLIKANSSVTESNSLSETYNYHSPVDSLFDAGVSSSEILNNQLDPVLLLPKIDQGSLIIDNLAKGRVLPQKGRLLQAVLQAGPLLQTLLVAGPLPRWRNPPQFQPFQIPPLSIRGCEVEALSQRTVPIVGPRSLGSQAFAQVSCGQAQVQPSPMFSIGSMASRTPSGMSTGVGYAPLAKRQRFS
ncbi:hypothetical protein PHJA_000379200 [Phtheirospermum japonicum]|uniref:Uncharacterized protein n=1 Tax=Phtheirospermum japonicum TaxID=374723 RepID=A0A830BJV0_9LAMI|nr:hypothetical protein PHJA_000379200 [Phtheirospermum japonicum]